MESVLARIVDNPKLPSPPTLTLRVLEQASRPNSTIAEIGKTISLDPALCGRMLKLVNSTLFGLSRPVTSIERALNLLGLNHVRSLVLSLSLPALRFRHATGAQMKGYWKSSVTAAMVCREIALRRRWPDPDSEMVSGLLCDIGVLLLQEAYPGEYARVFQQNTTGLDHHLCMLEEKEIGVDHAVAGAHFLKTWRLGDELTEAIRYHHRPADAPAPHRERAFLLFFAGMIARLHQTAVHAELLGPIVRQAAERYDLSGEQLFAFLDALKVKIDEFSTLLDMNLGKTESFSNLFARATENLSSLATQASLDSLRVREEKSRAEQGLCEAKQALQRTEEQLRQAQKMEAIGRLAGGLAHDFNNLLTVIIGNCELLLDLPSLAEEGRELAELIRQTGSRAADLTRQLLAFSRKQVLVPEILCLNTTVTNMSKMLRRLLGDDIDVVVRLADDLDTVRIDPGQIEQVLMNLAVNARDAMPKGGTLTMETGNLLVDDDVAARNPDMRPGRYVVLSVRDTGCGMNGDVLRQIFEPFFTTKEQGKGTGLGLATVHGIVRQSGGHITVSSAVGHGSVFHIYLPVQHGSRT